jgi:hypothetical protein
LLFDSREKVTYMLFFKNSFFNGMPFSDSFILLQRILMAEHIRTGNKMRLLLHLLSMLSRCILHLHRHMPIVLHSCCRLHPQ